MAVQGAWIVKVTLQRAWAEPVVVTYPGGGDVTADKSSVGSGTGVLIKRGTGNKEMGNGETRK